MRWIAAVVVAAVAMIGMSASVDAAPDRPDAPTHPIVAGHSRAICDYGDPDGQGGTFTLWYYHTIHYGTAHVTQCTYAWVSLPYINEWVCAQYVWNIPRPRWEWYDPIEGPGAGPPYCW